MVETVGGCFNHDEPDLRVRDCSGNPFCEERIKRLQRKARPAGARPIFCHYYL